MDEWDITRAAFCDELEKIGASLGQHHIPKVRAGRRPISADKLLKRDNAGTLRKHSHSSVPFSVGMKLPELPAKVSKRPGDLPSREDIVGNAKATNGQESVATIPGSGTTLYNIGNQPSERV